MTKAAVDGRRARGDRARRVIAHRGAEVASVKGLEAISLGGLARDVGMSKSGVAALFDSKEDLQLAVVASAKETFCHEVIEPSNGLPDGLQRLDALIEAWLDYVARPVFPGGCFITETIVEFDSRPGRVRDALAEARRAWLSLLAREVAASTPTGRRAKMAARLVAFEIDAILSAAIVAANLFDEPRALDDARRILRARLCDLDQRPPYGA